MKGFFFLLFTISLLVMLQIQSGMLQNVTTAAPRTSLRGTTTAVSIAATTTTTTTTKYSGAPALSSLGSVSVLIILTNALIQLLHLS